jgi:hypothetical protein
MIDPLALVQDMRPKPAAEASAFTPQRNAMRRRSDTPGIQGPDGQERSLSDLSARPGTENYRLGIQPPPCAYCNEDHNPIKERLGKYDHPYINPADVPEGGIVAMSGTPEVQVATPVTPPPAIATASKRVTVLSKSEDSFVFVVEQRSEGDWDDVASFKLSGNAVLQFLPILRCLGVTLKDRTGGDLVALQTG